MKRPFVTLKFAQTLDGRIAARDGSSRWISGPESRKFAHRLRAEADAVLVGIGTVLADNPSLTTRLVNGRNPARIVIDAKLRIPLNARFLKGVGTAQTVIFTTRRASKPKIRVLRARGAEVFILPCSQGGRIDILSILRILDTRGVKHLLVEGGRGIITSFLRAGLADRIVAIIAPRIMGEGVAAVGNLDVNSLNRALRLKPKNIKRLGKDIIYTSLIQK